jgi:hypothetical protein
MIPFKNKSQTASTLGIATLIASLALLLGGCNSGSSGSGSGAASGKPAQIQGNVSDIHGPINEGTVEVKDKSGKAITSFTLNGSNNHFMVSVPAGTTYPILLVVTPVAGKNQDTVRATVTSPLADRMDITDVTSLVVDAALALGGLTESNIAKASGGAIGLRQRQGVSAGSGGGGAGPGQSGGGAGNGGHGGHDMTGSGDRTGQPMPDMQH